MDRHPPQGRLVREHPAIGRRQPDRARDVGPQRQGRIEPRQRRPRPRARSPCVPLPVPRVPRHPVQAAHPRHQHAEIGHRGLAQEHAARLAHPCRRRRIRWCRRHVRERPRPQRRRCPRHRDIVLDRDRHPVERPQRLPGTPPRLAGPRLCQRPLTVDEVHGIQRRLPRLHPGQRRLHHLDRRDLPRRIAPPQLHGREFDQAGAHPGSSQRLVAADASRGGSRPPVPPAPPHPYGDPHARQRHRHPHRTLPLRPAPPLLRPQPGGGRLPGSTARPRPRRPGLLPRHHLRRTTPPGSAPSTWHSPPFSRSSSWAACSPTATRCTTSTTPRP